MSSLVKVLSLLIQQSKIEQQHGAEFLQNDSTINIRIRRDYIYEDAFEKLSSENGRDGGARPSSVHLASTRQRPICDERSA